MKLLRFGLIVLLELLICRPVFALTAETGALKHVRIETDIKTFDDDFFQLLVKIQPENGWHILAENPGDLGSPTEFLFDAEHAPNIVKINETTPKLFLYDDIIGQYGYDQTAYFLFKGKILPEASQSAFDLTVLLTACRQECLPQQYKRRFDPRQANQNATISATEYTEAFDSFPKETTSTVSLRAETSSLVFEIEPIEGVSQMPMYFISDQPDLFSAAEPQKIEKTSSGSLTVTVQTDHPRQAADPSGILVFEDQAFHVKALESAPTQPLPRSIDYSLFWLAFLAGLILNLMPCVFPILSLKALALSQQKQHSKRFQNALAYLSGVLSSFALVALMLYILRAKGEEIGWGFQLQSPIFVSVLLGLFIIIFLTMNDIIPLNGRFSGKLARYASLNHFATGFLAVVVATPCTGPFMGAAVGYALMQPEAASFVIFLSMGIGYALPMVIIELFPSAARRILPHSGQWSVRLKRFASVLIFLTCLWLAGVLLYQLKPLRNTEDTPWKPYQAELIDNLIQDGQPVLIDFTAKWCLTCLMNEQTTLKRQEFLDFAKRNHIALFKADWTNKDDAVSRALAHYGRQSVPLYVYYPPNMDGREIILPQILTLSDLMNRLKTDSTHHFDGTPHTLKILNPSN